MSYKLNAEQRERVNALIEQIINDPEAAAFEMIWLRDKRQVSMSSWKRTPNTEGWWIGWDGKYPSLHFVTRLKHREGLHVFWLSFWRDVATLGDYFECWQPVTVPSYFDWQNAPSQQPAHSEN